MKKRVEDQKLLDQASLLNQRLERISVDSAWARRSSGLRGSLLQWIERYQQSTEDSPVHFTPDERTSLQTLLDSAFQMLKKAAMERFRKL